MVYEVIKPLGQAAIQLLFKALGLFLGLLLFNWGLLISFFWIIPGSGAAYFSYWLVIMFFFGVIVPIFFLVLLRIYLPQMVLFHVYEEYQEVILEMLAQRILENSGKLDPAALMDWAKEIRPRILARLFKYFLKIFPWEEIPEKLAEAEEGQPLPVEELTQLLIDTVEEEVPTSWLAFSYWRFWRWFLVNLILWGLAFYGAYSLYSG